MDFLARESPANVYNRSRELLIAANISAEQFIGVSGSGYAIGLAMASYEWTAMDSRSCPDYYSKILSANFSKEKYLYNASVS